MGSKRATAKLCNYKQTLGNYPISVRVRARVRVMVRVRVRVRVRVQLPMEQPHKLRMIFN